MTSAIDQGRRPRWQACLCAGTLLAVLGAGAAYAQPVTVAPPTQPAISTKSMMDHAVEAYDAGNDAPPYPSFAAPPAWATWMP